MLRTVLEKAIQRYRDEIKALNADISALELQRMDTEAELNTAVLEVQKLCPHEKTTRKEGAYYPSGYDYYSEQHYTIVCDSCSKVIESKCIRGTTFG